MAFLLISACGLVTGLFGVFVSSSGALREVQERERCTGRHRLPGYTAYTLGASFDGLAAAGTTRYCNGPPSGRVVGPHPASVVWYSAITYGTCTPEGSEGGCGPPLEIESWPECDRDYWTDGRERSVSAMPPATSFRLSGSYKIPTAVFEKGITNRIELYTGKTTVVVFTDGPDASRRALAAAHALAAEIAPHLSSLSASQLRRLAVSTRGCSPTAGAAATRVPHRPATLRVR